jgi:hypothetical protein
MNVNTLLSEIRFDRRHPKHRLRIFRNITQNSHSMFVLKYKIWVLNNKRQ